MTFTDWLAAGAAAVLIVAVVLVIGRKELDGTWRR